MPAPVVYGDESIHRPPVYGEGQTAARHRAARARARVERPDTGHLGKPLTGPALEEHGAQLLARRRATRDGATSPDPGDLDRRLAAQQARRNAKHALGELGEHFEDYLQAQLGDVPTVVEWASDAAAGSADWLVLLGSTGVGKTWQAVAAYKAVTWDRGSEGLAITVSELLLRSLPSAPDRINLRTYERVDVLLLDDLTGEQSDWDRRVLFQLIDARSASGRLTIVTSNLLREEVRTKLGDRIASRLSQRVRLVLMEGPDRRTRG